MSQESARIVQKLWSYCNVLRDDGLSYQDYLEQLTTLLFLKMAEERSLLTGEEQPIPRGHRWSDLSAPQMEGARLEGHYRESLKTLGAQSGMLGLVFRKAQNKIQDPAKLRQLIVDLIGKEQWLSMSSDVKGDAYEGLASPGRQDAGAPSASLRDGEQTLRDEEAAFGRRAGKMPALPARPCGTRTRAGACGAGRMPALPACLPSGRARP